MFLRLDVPDTAPAVFDPEARTWIDYATLRDRTASRATELSSTKKLIFLFTSNSAACIVTLLGALQAGHAVALLDPTLADAQVAPLLSSYMPDLVLGPDCPGIRCAAQLPGAHDLGLQAGLRTLAIDRPATEGLHPELALLLSTSGSTGSPKFVRLSASNIESNAKAIATVLAIKSTDRVFAHLPLHYSFGFSIISSHLVGGASILPSHASIASTDAWRMFREHGCTSFPGVPSHFDVLRRLDIDRLDVPTLSCLLQAGGRMAPTLVDHFAGKMAARKGRLFIMYGQTEAGPRMTTLPAERVFEATDSVGPALPGGHIEIRDADGTTLPPHRTGEVVYFGPNVMMGYALSRKDLVRGPELTDGLHTGDLGYLDESGYLRLTGRANRFAKVHGVRVSLDEVEALLRLDRPVAAIAPGDDRVLVLVENGGDLEFEAIRDTLAEALRVSPVSIRVRAIASIPTKSSGKTDYAKLADIA